MENMMQNYLLETTAIFFVVHRVNVCLFVRRFLKKWYNNDKTKPNPIIKPVFHTNLRGKMQVTFTT